MKRTHDRYLPGGSRLALLVLLLPTVAYAELTRVWALDEGEKIKRTEIWSALETAASNRVWNTTPDTVTLFGAKNEVLGFQIILVGGGAATSNVDVRITDLANGSSVIRGSPWSGAAGAGRPSAGYDPFNYLDRDIELFTQQYVNIAKRTDTGGNGWFSSNLPDEYSGWVPDALIPFAAAQGRGGAPFSVPAGTVQGVWADIYIPKHAAAGTFTGKILIYVGASLYRAIPISLSVRNFTLPDRPNAKGIFGLWEPSTVAAAHGVTADTAGYYEIEAKYHQMGHRHKMDLHRARIENLGEMDAYHLRYLQDGAPLYTQSQGYYGPGEGVPNQTFAIGMYGELPDEYGGVSYGAGPYSCTHEKFGASYAWNEPEWRACPGSDGCALASAPSGTYNGGVMEKNASAVYPGENLMVFNFYGTGIRVRGVRKSDGGHANILVDGVYATAVDFYRASDAAEEVFAITTLPLGWHQLKIRIPGTKDPRSSNTYVRVDRFDVISGGVTTPYDESFVKELIENCDPSNWATGSHQWADWFAGNAPSVKFWKYLHPDEYIFKPSPWAEDIIRAQANWTPLGENGRRRVPTFVTAPTLLDPASQQQVIGAVDTWGLAADRLFYHSQPLNRFHGTESRLGFPGADRSQLGGLLQWLSSALRLGGHRRAGNGFSRALVGPRQVRPGLLFPLEHDARLGQPQPVHDATRRDAP